MLVIADPQLTDPYSYKQTGLLLKLTEFYSDIYMKRNFRVLQQVLKPDGVIFVGDLMDGGREWVDNPEQYKNELQRFQAIFRPRRKMLTLNVPGNHDIGFGETVVEQAYDTYVSTFGQANSLVHIADHNIVLVDTMSYSAEERQTDASEKAQHFVGHIKLHEKLDPERTILISHVPLFRPENSPCGPRRKSPPIANRAGYQYQNLIQAWQTYEIMTAIKPTLVISGDDHDDCVYVHTNGPLKTVEHTISTFSWLQGNPYPAYGVLSLKPKDGAPLSQDAPNYQLDVCSLPSQLNIYPWYVVMFLLTLLDAYFHKERYQRLPVSGKPQSMDGRLHRLLMTLSIGIVSYFVIIAYVWIK
ncbi:Metallo-dependent phosphatase-like protein [Gorgonomyces haynaldii]|nr:Metallo-dependent phosphatase-like protein [Gorgonomyces haynaldii]